MYGAESGTVGLWQRGTANHPRAQREPAGGEGWARAPDVTCEVRQATEKATGAM